MQAALNIIWLAIQIAGLNPKPVTDYVSRLDFRVGALETRKQQVYLIAKVGTSNERVIGIAAPGTGYALSEEFGGMVYGAGNTSAATRYETPDCSGTIYAGNPPTMSGWLYQDAEKVYLPGPESERNIQAEMFRGKCSPQSPTLSIVRSLTLIGFLGPYNPQADFVWQLR